MWWLARLTTSWRPNQLPVPRTGSGRDSSDWISITAASCSLLIVRVQPSQIKSNHMSHSACFRRTCIITSKTPSCCSHFITVGQRPLRRNVRRPMPRLYHGTCASRSSSWSDCKTWRRSRGSPKRPASKPCFDHTYLTISVIYYDA